MNGYQLSPGDTTGMTSNGDSLLMLQTALPIAIRFDAYVRAQGGTTVATDFQTPLLAKLISGGQVARNVSYYIYLLLAENGRTGPIEDANVTFSRPFGTPTSITVGQFQIIDPLWERELRIPVEDYAILSVQPGSSAANLTYDRGITLSFSPTPSTSLFGEVVNGNGIGEAVNGHFDGDSPKTTVLLFTQNVGPLRLGALGYYGTQRVVPTGQTASVSNLTRMIGPSVFGRFGNVDPGAQVLYRDDSDPDFSGAPSHVVTRGGFVEANWWPTGRGTRVLVTGLYNLIDSSRPGANYQTVAVNLSWLYARNLRLAAEGMYDLEHRHPGVALGLVTAF